MKKNKLLILLFVIVFTLGCLGLTGCSNDDYEEVDLEELEKEQEETKKKIEELEAEDEKNSGEKITAIGADFDVKLIEKTDAGVVIECVNKSDTDHLTCIANSVTVKGSTYDPADENGALSLIQDDYSPNATFEINAGGKITLKVSCKDCTKADDYNDLVINFDESAWEENAASPKTYRFEDLKIRFGE